MAIAKKKHPGFKAVQNKIAKKQGVSKEAAGAILAAGNRKASYQARKANPRLNKTSGMPPMSKAPRRKAK